MDNQVRGPKLILPVSPDRDHMRGKPTAPVELLEYGDFECEECSRSYRIVGNLLVQHGDKFKFVFRYFPLSKIHPHAERAAEAAEAAGAQGQFWPMHNELFEHQDALFDHNLLEYAEKLGLDQGRFKREMLDNYHLPRVREDFTSGVRSGVNRTPTFFINGYRYDGSWDHASLLAAIQQTTELHA